ncbi:hypothetical protein [uncultured Croceitalea sp.]|uniref:hypothetical protein n=1 Tax=uncultured Croceitalea sp. TaxID=1798908 RepID=UPI00374E58FB
MLKKLISYFDLGSSLYGLEIFSEQKEALFHLILLRKSKGELVIVDEWRFSEWIKLLEVLDKKIPICLTINSNGILEKLTQKKIQNDVRELVDQEFPGLDFNRFFYNVSEFKNLSYIAIAERKWVLELLEKFKIAGVSVLCFHLGSSVLSVLLPHLKEESIITNIKEISFSEGEYGIKASSGRKTEMQYLINGLNISNKSLIGFGNVLQQFLSVSKVHTNYEEKESFLKKEFQFLRRFQMLIWPVIGFFLILLLGNFLVFNQYYEKKHNLELELNSNSFKKEKLLELKESVTTKEKHVDAIFSSKNSMSTLYLDDIGKTVPTTIILKSITYQPLAKPLQQGKSIEQEFNTIVISGETINDDDFSNWITTLERLTWVVQVKTLGFGHENAKSAFFELKVSIDDE